MIKGDGVGNLIIVWFFICLVEVGNSCDVCNCGLFCMCGELDF